MAAFEVIALDTATPQLRAPGASDTYTFPRAVELPLGTANGVLYLNGSKVVTSGSGLTFDGTTLVSTVSDAGTALKLAGATGKVRVRPYVDSTFGVVFDSTNAAESAYLPMSFYGTNIYTNPDTAAIWRISGSEQMRLTSTGLGIGTSSLSNLLTLGGATGGIDFEGWNDNRIVLRQKFDASYYQQIVFDAANRDFRIQSNSSDSAARVTFWTGASGTVTEHMRLDSSGNLGLGVTPSAWAGAAFELQTGAALYGFANTTNVAQNAYYDGSWKYKTTAAAALGQVAQGSHYWFTAPSGTAGNAISFTQAMTLDASGNLALGTTSASDKLHVEGAISTFIRAQSGNNSTRGGFKALGKTAGGANVQVDFVAYGDAPECGVNVTTNHRLTLGTNNTERASIPAAGGMVVGTAALATTATDGFLYVPTCAGTPTGTPSSFTGTAPIVINTTNNKLYFYSGGAWRDAGP
jgi:hypothetical protein